MYSEMILWMEEILHQLLGGKHPMTFGCSTIPGGAGFSFIHSIMLSKIRAIRNPLMNHIPLPLDILGSQFSESNGE